MKMLQVGAYVVASWLLGTGGAFAIDDGASATGTVPANADAGTLMFSTDVQQAQPIQSAEETPAAKALRELIESDLNRYVVREPDRAGVEAFYRARGFAPLWTSKGEPLPAARDAVAVLQGAAADGFDPGDYSTPRFADADLNRQASDELKLTNAVLAFARHASTGRVAFTRVSGSMYFDLKFSSEDMLRKLAESANVGETLRSLLPQHPQYKALKAALAAARNGGDAKRADLIAANMERWRWLPRELGAAYVLVNIPDYTLKVVDRGETVWTTRIVAGKPGKLETPLISQPMKFITVNPTWNVPPSIIRNEYLPALQRDPGALSRLGLRVEHNKDGSLRIFQPPGARNALGRIRFNFPNRFLVYQHDTPQKHLFDKSARAFSHGCMRVQNPEQYAQVLLSISQPEERYTAARIRGLYGSDERTINFKRPIPVYVTYQTAFVDDGGKLQTRADVYGHDKAIARLLRDERQVADIPIKRDYTSSSKPVMARLPSREPTSRHAGARDNAARQAFGMDTAPSWNGYQAGYWNSDQSAPRYSRDRFSSW